MIGTPLQERVEIYEASEKGEPVWRLERRMSVRARTIRKWRQRGRQHGRAGLQSQMGRPKTGALGGYPTEMAETIRHLRETNPGWGASTLRTELELHDAFAEQKLPHRSTIARFLKEEGLIGKRVSKAALPENDSVQANHAHQVWEFDARGQERIPDIGIVTLLDLNDRFSHARWLSYPCWLGKTKIERHATTDDYQACLRIAFMEWGLPEVIQVDHESVFYDNRTRSPFPTRFHLWRIALGISLTCIPVRQPQKQGMTERSHQLWYHQVIDGHSFPDWSALYHALEKRRPVLNHHLPCASLHVRTPLVAHPKAIHSGRPYHLTVEAALLDLDRVYTYLAQGRWFRLASRSGTLSLGGQIYYIGSKWREQQIEITFDSDSLLLLFADEAGNSIHSLPINGLAKDILMGAISDLARLPSFQFPLPLSWDEQQMARLFETISGTT